MPYTTQQLLDILEREMRATCEGKRVLLSPGDRLDNPVLAQAMDLTQAGKVFAYRDFRQQIHTYQQAHGVSGIIWRDCRFNGDRLRFPEIHPQLMAIEGDKAQLMAAKASIGDFWQRHTESLPYWLAVDKTRPLSRESFAELWQEGEWAELDATQHELFLGICWGNPREYPYQWAKPLSGYHRVVAAQTLPTAIKV